MERPKGAEEMFVVSETPEYKAVAAERDELKAKAGRLTGELDRARSAFLALGKVLRESDAEARLKERDALRRQMGEAVSRAAALERERDAARAELPAAQRAVAAARREADLLRQTVELVQAGRDTAQRERDMVAAKALEADGRAAALAAELGEAKKAAAQAGGTKTGKGG